MGQLELAGWNDGTLLEVCVDYYGDRALIRYPEYRRGDQGDDYCAQPSLSRVCRLTAYPTPFHCADEDSPLWVEQIEVRALGLQGQVSEVTRLDRDDIPQFHAMSDSDHLAWNVDPNRLLPITLTEAGEDTMREPEPCISKLMPWRFEGTDGPTTLTWT